MFGGRTAVAFGDMFDVELAIPGGVVFVDAALVLLAVWLAVALADGVVFAAFWAAPAVLLGDTLAVTFGNRGDKIFGGKPPGLTKSWRISRYAARNKLLK